MRNLLPSTGSRSGGPCSAACDGKSLAVAFLILWCSAAFSADVRQNTAPAGDPSAWPSAIKSQYDAIRALPGAPDEPVIAAIRKLGKNGPAARPALDALANDAGLPEPHRAASGIMSAYFIRYDVNALCAMTEPGRNSFAQRQSIEFLADIGGPQIKDFLSHLGNGDALLAAYVGKTLPRVPPVEAVSEDSRRMLSDILLQPEKGKLSAAVSLAALHEGKTTMDPWLESLAISPVSDDQTQINAAIALVKTHAKSVPELTALCARNKHR